MGLGIDVLFKPILGFQYNLLRGYLLVVPQFELTDFYIFQYLVKNRKN